MVRPPGAWPDPPKREESEWEFKVRKMKELGDSIEAAISEDDTYSPDGLSGPDIFTREEKAKLRFWEDEKKIQAELARVKKEAKAAQDALREQERIEEEDACDYRPFNENVEIAVGRRPTPMTPVPRPRYFEPNWPIATDKPEKKPEEPKKPLPFDDPENMPKRSIRLDDE